jgi:hypothetical protein
MSSSTLVVAAAGATGSTSQGASHRHLLQLRCWMLLELLAPPQGPAIDVWLNLVPVASIFLVTPTRGHYDKHYYYKQGKFHKKRRQVLRKNIFGSLR